MGMVIITTPIQAIKSSFLAILKEYVVAPTNIKFGSALFCIISIMQR